MMLKIFIFSVFFGLGYTASVKNRLDFLEMQVNRESFKTRSDIIELRELISVLNATESVTDGKSADIPAYENELKALSETLERFMKEQHDRTVALSTAITEEKALTRKMLKIIQDLADSNTESVLEIEETVEQSKAERDKFKIDWKTFADGIKGEMNQIGESVKELQEKLKNFDGSVIVLSSKKTNPCPKNWLREGEKCYLYEKYEKLSWYGARIKCDDLGGKLAEPDTEEGMLHILTAVDDNVWIGATDEGQEGHWVWASSQKPLDDSILWQTGQPNNLYENQHCLEVGLSSMNDESCLQDNKYICEKAVDE